MSIDVMKQALAALENSKSYAEFDWVKNQCDRAITTVSAAIEQAQEPVAWMYEHDGMVHDTDNPPIFAVNKWNTPVGEPYTETPLYTAPRQWQGLTVWCGCGDGIMPNSGAKCGNCLAAESASTDSVVDSDEKASAYMDARLWEFIDMAAAFPKAKADSRTWPHLLVYAPKTEKEPVAWYVKRVAPGMRDDGRKLGPWFKKSDAEEWVDENHILCPLIDIEKNNDEKY